MKLPNPKKKSTPLQVEQAFKRMYRELMKTLGPAFIPTNGSELFLRGFASADASFNQNAETKTAFRMLALFAAVAANGEPFKAWLEAAWSRFPPEERAKLQQIGKES